MAARSAGARPKQVCGPLVEAGGGVVGRADDRHQVGRFSHCQEGALVEGAAFGGVAGQVPARRPRWSSR